jgi:hypothetical protein
MLNLVQIESDSSLARDISSHAVISMTDDKLKEYQTKRKIAESRESLFLSQQKEIESLKNDVSEIKQMLQVLIQR